VCPSAAAKETAGTKEMTRLDPRCLLDTIGDARLKSDLEQGAGDLTVIAALIPGASFMGVEEARRRTRYAVLAGLGAEGFVPKDSERMGLLRTRPCDLFAGCGVNHDRIAEMDIFFG
jgi:hypothetical protein